MDISRFSIGDALVRTKPSLAGYKDGTRLTHVGEVFIFAGVNNNVIYAMDDQGRYIGFDVSTSRTGWELLIEVKSTPVYENELESSEEDAIDWEGEINYLVEIEDYETLKIIAEKIVFVTKSI